MEMMSLKLDLNIKMGYIFRLEIREIKFRKEINIRKEIRNFRYENYFSSKKLLKA